MAANVVASGSQLRRGPKLIIFRYKSKSRYRRKTGHRQDYTELTIQDIWANGASLLPAKKEAEVEPEAETEETTAAKSSASTEKETVAAGRASPRKGKAAKASAASAETEAEDTEEPA